MGWLLVKFTLSAVLIVAISELARRNSLLGAVLASVPLISVLAMTWLYVDTGDVARVASLSRSILWLVLPSLVLFLALPWLLVRGCSYWLALALSLALTVVAYLLCLALLSLFGQQSQ